MAKRIIALVMIMMFVVSGFAALADYCRVVNSSMPVYSSRSLSRKIGTVPKWMIAVVKSTSSGVAKLKVNGKTCYAKASYLANAYDVSHFELYGTCRTARKCKIYSYPSTKSKCVTVKKGVTIETVLEYGNWILCRSMNGKIMGYIQNKNVML